MVKKRLIKEEPQAMVHIKKIVLFQYISLICNLVSIFSISQILEKLVQKDFENTSWQMYLFIIIVATITRYIFRLKTAKSTFLASGRVKLSLRTKLYNKIVSLGANYQEKASIAKVVQLFSEGTEQMEIYFSKYLPQFFYSMTAPILLFIVVARYSLKTGLALLICVPLIPGSIIAVQKLAKKLLAKYWAKYTKLGDDFYENINGLTTLKIYNADARQHEKMNENAEHFRKITMKVLTMQLNSVTLMDLMAYMGAAIGIIFSLLELQAGKITVGQAFFIMLISSEFFIPLRLLGSFFHIAMNGMSASDSLFEILDIKQDDSNNKIIDDFSKISFKNVYFSYNQDRQILKDINFEVEKGNFIGIVGESGSGKSTIASIITAQYKNYTGDIFVKDTQIRDIQTKCLWKNICLVKNENYIFKGTVKENLEIAKENCTDDDMIRALKQVNLWDFLETKDGLETMLQENANNLSGGQKQRLAIARALLLDSPIYIFDEATSNIDVESEEIILNLIEELKKQKTILFISHRLINVKNADNILVLENGVIVEQGNFEQLVSAGKQFATLYKKQSDLENFAKEDK